MKTFIGALIGMAFIATLFPQTLLAQDNPSMSIKLEKAVICRGVENRMPIGAGSVFPAGIGHLYCFTKVVGADRETEIAHHWYLNGKLVSSVVLPVKSASWRTWSSKKIDTNDSGDWMVEVLTEDGQAIESILFFVQ
jgi:hypothetical protein